MNSAIKELIIEELESLSEQQLQEVLADVRKKKHELPQGMSGEEFVRRFAGLFSKEDAEGMMRAIEEDCERIDLDKW